MPSLLHGKYYEQIDGQQIEVDCDTLFPNSWQLCRLSFLCQLIDGTKTKGKHICLDAKFLRGKSAGTMIEQGKFVSKGDNIILVDGENSGETPGGAEAVLSARSPHKAADKRPENDTQEFPAFSKPVISAHERTPVRGNNR